MIKCPDKSSLGNKGFIPDHSSSSPSLQGCPTARDADICLVTLHQESRRQECRLVVSPFLSFPSGSAQPMKRCPGHSGRTFPHQLTPLRKLFTGVSTSQPEGKQSFPELPFWVIPDSAKLTPQINHHRKHVAIFSNFFPKGKLMKTDRNWVVKSLYVSWNFPGKTTLSRVFLDFAPVENKKPPGRAGPRNLTLTSSFSAQAGWQLWSHTTLAIYKSRSCSLLIKSAPPAVIRSQETSQRVGPTGQSQSPRGHVTSPCYCWCQPGKATGRSQ